jgi:hypothetical protein
MRDYIASVDESLMEDELELKQIDDATVGCYEGDVKAVGGLHGCTCKVKKTTRSMNNYMEKLEAGKPSSNPMLGAELAVAQEKLL